MSDDAPVIYRGEPAPRRRGVGLLLTVIMPGLGHVYAGDFGGGLIRYLAGFFAALTALFAWRALLFQPHLPLLVMAVAYVVYMAALLREVWHLTGSDTDEYVLQGFNHPVIYVALLGLCHIGPVALLVDRVDENLVGAVDVSDGAMFPMLFIGDRVIVDRTAYRAHPPERGDLVVLRARSRDGSALVRRVVAGPGDTLSFEGRAVVVNALTADRTELGELSLPGIDNRGEPPDIRLKGWRETNGGASYVITHRPDRERVFPEALVMPEGRWYLLADNRDSGPDSRDFGHVAREDVLGRPLYVWWSESQGSGGGAGATAWNRIGLAAK